MLAPERVTQLAIPSVSSPRALAAILPHVARANDAIPLEILANGSLLVGVVDPTNEALLNALRVASHREVTPVAFALSEILGRLAVSYPAREAAAVGGADSPEALFLAAIREGVRTHASDVTFEHRGDEGGQIVMLIDGGAHVWRDIDEETLLSLVRTGLNKAGVPGAHDERVGHRGRLTLGLEGRTVTLRLTSTPTFDGHMMLSMRLIMPYEALPHLEEIGMQKKMLDRYLRVLSRANGLIVNSGPPGQGKTTFTFASLQAIWRPHKIFRTVECPVEMRVPFLSQNSVEDGDEGDWTYAKAIAHLLAIPSHGAFFGEMRDPYTVSQAVRFALSGRPLFATTHGNTAPQVLFRLLHEGASRMNLAEVLLASISQRLVPQLCTRCRVASPGAGALAWMRAAVSCPSLHDTLDRAEIYVANPNGCDACLGGYRGRAPIFELLVGTDGVKRAILTATSAAEIAASDPDYEPLWVDAARMVLTGKTSPEAAADLVTLP